MKIQSKDLMAAERAALADCQDDDQRAFYRELFRLARLGLWAHNFVKPALDRFRKGAKAVGYLYCGHKFACDCQWNVIARYSKQLLDMAKVYETPKRLEAVIGPGARTVEPGLATAAEAEGASS